MCSTILVFVGHMPSDSKGVAVSPSHVAEGDAGVRNVPPFSPYTDRSLHPSESKMHQLLEDKRSARHQMVF